MLIAGFLQINFQMPSAAPDNVLCTEFSAVVFAIMTEASSYAPAADKDHKKIHITPLYRHPRKQA